MSKKRLEKIAPMGQATFYREFDSLESAGIVQGREEVYSPGGCVCRRKRKVWTVNPKGARSPRLDDEMDVLNFSAADLKTHGRRHKKQQAAFDKRRQEIVALVRHNPGNNKEALRKIATASTGGRGSEFSWAFDSLVDDGTLQSQEILSDGKRRTVWTVNPNGGACSPHVDEFSGMSESAEEARRAARQKRNQAANEKHRQDLIDLIRKQNPPASMTALKKIAPMSQGTFARVFASLVADGTLQPKKIVYFNGCCDRTWEVWTVKPNRDTLPGSAKRKPKPR